MQDQNKNPEQVVDKAVGEIAKDFKVVGSHRVHSWYTWAAVGIIVGVVVGAIYVANNAGTFEMSDAKTGPGVKVSTNQCLQVQRKTSQTISKEKETYLLKEEKIAYDLSLKNEYPDQESRKLAAIGAAKIEKASQGALTECNAALTAKEDADQNFCDTSIKPRCEASSSACVYNPNYTVGNGSCSAITPCSIKPTAEGAAQGTTYVCKAQGATVPRGCSCDLKPAAVPVAEPKRK